MSIWARPKFNPTAFSLENFEKRHIGNLFWNISFKKKICNILFFGNEFDRILFFIFIYIFLQMRKTREKKRQYDNLIMKKVAWYIVCNSDINCKFEWQIWSQFKVLFRSSRKWMGMLSAVNLRIDICFGNQL